MAHSLQRFRSIVTWIQHRAGQHRERPGQRKAADLITSRKQGAGEREGDEIFWVISTVTSPLYTELTF